MTAFARRLDALEASLPDPDLEALIQRVAAADGLTSTETEHLRTAVRDSGRRYRGMSIDEMVAAIARENGLTPEETEELLASAIRYAEMPG